MKHGILALLALGFAVSAVTVDARETPRERREREAKEAQDKASGLVKPCREAYDASNWDEVISACTKLIDAKGLQGEDLGSVYMMRATAYDRKGACASGMPDLDAAQPLRPKDYQVPMMQYACASKNKDAAKAASSLDAALALAPDNVDLLRAKCVSLVNAQIQTQQFAEAIPACEKVIGVSPDDKEILGVLGGMYEKEKQTAKATATYQKLLSLDPGNKSATDGLKRLSGK